MKKMPLRQRDDPPGHGERARRLAPRLGAALLAALALAACISVGPDYRRPATQAPAAYKELDGWKPAEPGQAASGSPWWSIYGDPVLDQLEQQVDVSNQNLKAAEAAYRQAEALVGEARAGYFPSLGLGASAQRQRAFSAATGSVLQNDFGVSASASWAPDLWGRIRRGVEASSASAQASADDVAAARLSAQSSLAADYFALRVADELKGLLQQTVAAYQDTLEITRNQFDAGVVAQTDVISAETQLEGTQAQLINAGVQRAQLEHAIAVLVGKAPAEFSLPPSPLLRNVPVVPAGLPSTLLERRPDIAGAERRMAAANAQIGVAVAAYYPDLTLAGSYGFASSTLGSLLRAANTVWSVGPQLSETLFDGGLRRSQVAAARAAYDQDVATYRQTVLAAFQQVEDELSTLRILEQQADLQDVAVRSAREAVRLTLNQYEAGTVAYTSVVTAQAIALSDEQAVLAVLGSRLAASVALVAATGGGWDSAAGAKPVASSR
ncbi:MAG TPA: efflux transporter outer membrane subunit [Burkholderiaceae bacterium]|nr:efflux transporter outer membrane subunit [Burkholderiaceae bacterium]